ncbi:hypothetical protein GCM10028808_73220 [Spirosoma migulaei]
MLSYFLDNQPVSGPLKVDGLTLNKSLNRTYWGFVYRKLGYLKGPSNLRFEDPDAMATMDAALLRSGLKAQTAFRIEQVGQILYDGFVDYATYDNDGDGIEIGLRDDQAVYDFSTNASTTYALAPNQLISLHERRLGSLPGLITDPNNLTVQRSETSAVVLSHSVPFTRRADTDDTISGTLAPVVTPLASDPCYRNTSALTQLVKLKGLISVTASASTNQAITLRAVPSDNLANVSVIAQRPITSTPTLFQVAVDVSVYVAAGASLKLEWIGSSTATKWTFTYDSLTTIALSDEKSYAASSAYSMLALDAFKQLVSKLTDGKLSFRSDWLSKGEGYGLMVANGAGIRNINKNLSVSLNSLFQGLTAIWNLALWVDGQTIRVEPKDKKPASKTHIDTILNRREKMATEFVYNSVKAGFSTWQADGSSLSADEPNGLRTYSTGISTVINELNLVSEFITASGIIEVQRRKQFDPKTASSNTADSLDDKLFLINAVPGATGWKAETYEKISFATGNYDVNTLYNARMSPGRSLYRWENWLSASLPLAMQSVQGSATLITTSAGVTINEATPTLGQPARVPRLISLTVPLSMIEYANLGDTIEYVYRGNLHEGDLLDATWQLTKEAETGTLLLLER